MDCMMDAYNVVFAKSKLGCMKQLHVCKLSSCHAAYDTCILDMFPDDILYFWIMICNSLRHKIHMTILVLFIALLMESFFIFPKFWSFICCVYWFINVICCHYHRSNIFIFFKLLLILTGVFLRNSQIF